MTKQEKFNNLFLEKNKEIDKVIEECWKSVLFSDCMRNLYEEKIDKIFGLNVGYRKINFYQEENDRYILEMSSGKDGEHTFHIWFKDDTINYELHHYPSESCTNNEALCNLPDNKAKIQYLKRKVSLLEWSKDYKYELYEVLEELINIDEDIKDLKEIKF